VTSRACANLSPTADGQLELECSLCEGLQGVDALTHTLGSKVVVHVD
jgi:hypothetical protein